MSFYWELIFYNHVFHRAFVFVFVFFLFFAGCVLGFMILAVKYQFNSFYKFSWFANDFYAIHSVYLVTIVFIQVFFKDSIESRSKDILMCWLFILGFDSIYNVFGSVLFQLICVLLNPRKKIRGNDIHELVFIICVFCGLNIFTARWNAHRHYILLYLRCLL